MRMVFKILLAPVWLILFLLKWTSLISTGISIFFSPLNPSKKAKTT